MLNAVPFEAQCHAGWRLKSSPSGHWQPLLVRALFVCSYSKAAATAIENSALPAEGKKDQIFYLESVKSSASGLNSDLWNHVWVANDDIPNRCVFWDGFWINQVSGWGREGWEEGLRRLRSLGLEPEMLGEVNCPMAAWFELAVLGFSLSEPSIHPSWAKPTKSLLLEHLLEGFFNYYLIWPWPSWRSMIIPILLE